MAQHTTNLVTVTERGVMTETSVRRGPKVDEPSSKGDDGGDDDNDDDDDDDVTQPRRRRHALGVLDDGDGEDDDEGEVSILTELLMAASVGSKQLTAGSRLLTVTTSRMPCVCTRRRELTEGRLTIRSDSHWHCARQGALDRQCAS